MDTLSIGTPASKSSTEKVSRKRCAWASGTPPSSKSRLRLRCQSPDRAFRLRESGPKIIRAVWNCIESVHHDGRQWAIHRCAGLRSNQKEFVAQDSLAWKCYCVSDSQPAIAEQKHQRSQPNCIGLVR